MKRHELTDKQWAIVDPLISVSTARTGRPPRDRHTLVSGIFWILNTGAPWRDLLERFGPWQTTYHHFPKWRRECVFDIMLEALQIRLNDRGLIDWDLWCIDGANVRAARAAADADKKASKGTQTNRRTTRWAAAEAGSDRSSAW